MQPYLWALLTAMTWGVVPIFEKLGLTRAPVMTGLFFRCIGVIVGLLVLLLFKWTQIKESLPEVSHFWIFLVIGGFLASFVGQIFFYNGLKNGEASQVVPIAAIYPLISFLLGLVFLGEKFTFAKLAGVGCVLAGVVLLK